MATDVLRLVMATSCGRSFSATGWRLVFLTTNPIAEALDHIEAHWNEENGQERSREHAADHHAAYHLPRDGTGAGGCPQRYAPKKKCERRHQDRTQPEFCASQSSINEG